MRRRQRKRIGGPSGTEAMASTGSGRSNSRKGRSAASLSREVDELATGREQVAREQPLRAVHADESGRAGEDDGSSHEGMISSFSGDRFDAWVGFGQGRCWRAANAPARRRLVRHFRPGPGPGPACQRLGPSPAAGPAPVAPRARCPVAVPDPAGRLRPGGLGAAGPGRRRRRAPCAGVQNLAAGRRALAPAQNPHQHPAPARRARPRRRRVLRRAPGRPGAGQSRRALPRQERRRGRPKASNRVAKKGIDLGSPCAAE